jgi:hypothetical protein
MDDGKKVFDSLFGDQKIDWDAKDARIVSGSTFEGLESPEIAKLLEHGYQMAMANVPEGSLPAMEKCDWRLLVRAAYLHQLAAQYDEHREQGLWGPDGQDARFFTAYKPWDVFPRMIMLEGGPELWEPMEDSVPMGIVPIETCFGRLLVEGKSGLAVRLSSEPEESFGINGNTCRIELFPVRTKARPRTGL